MSLDQFYEHRTIRGKDIYIVDDHHKVLSAWALIRRSSDRAPNLITIDHHTDTYEAFLGHAHWEAYEGRVQDREEFRLRLAESIDWQSDQSIADAIEALRHDEHIDAATCSGVIDNAFCIQLSDGSGTSSLEEIAYAKNRQDNWPKAPTLPPPQRPMTYAPAGNRIYALPFDCFIGCETMPHNDDCEVRQANEIIETKYLEDQLARGAVICRCIGLGHLEHAPYVLDIDLDAFHTRRAIAPEDPSAFYRLIKNAVAITIATEAECVEEEWLDEDGQMTAAELLEALLIHIDKAL